MVNILKSVKPFLKRGNMSVLPSNLLWCGHTGILGASSWSMGRVWVAKGHRLSNSLSANNGRIWQRIRWEEPSEYAGVLTNVSKNGTRCVPNDLGTLSSALEGKKWAAKRFLIWRSAPSPVGESPTGTANQLLYLWAPSCQPGQGCRAAGGFREGASEASGEFHQSSLCTEIPRWEASFNGLWERPRNGFHQLADSNDFKASGISSEAFFDDKNMFSFAL